MSLSAGVGVVTATVTNSSAGPQRVVLGAFPATAPSPSDQPSPRPSAASWVVVERPVREIAAGQTEQFTVVVTAPPGVPAGGYPLRLIAYSATAAPEENADQARVVEIVVPPQPPTVPTKRPWWLVVVLAGLVLAVAVVVFQVTRDKGAPPSPTPSPTRALCKPGLAPRLAGPADFVCVSPAAAKEAILDNDPEVQKARKNDPPGGPFGPDTCRQGYVWRDAFAGDRVCVVGQTRDRTAQENRDGPANAGPDAPP